MTSPFRVGAIAEPGDEFHVDMLTTSEALSLLPPGWSPYKLRESVKDGRINAIRKDGFSRALLYSRADIEELADELRYVPEPGDLAKATEALELMQLCINELGAAMPPRGDKQMRERLAVIDAFNVLCTRFGVSFGSDAARWRAH